jgi:hypothetical protein
MTRHPDCTKDLTPSSGLSFQNALPRILLRNVYHLLLGPPVEVLDFLAQIAKRHMEIFRAESIMGPIKGRKSTEPNRRPQPGEDKPYGRENQDKRDVSAGTDP